MPPTKVAPASTVSSLGTLGASAAVVSIVAGVGEFLGYSLRAVSGFVADRTGKYWLVTFIGYSINLLAVPAMALAGSWQTASAFLLAERIGRAIRKPTVEAMLSYSTGKHGSGWVYAVNTALDETGATLGPLLIALLLFKQVTFRSAYGWLPCFAGGLMSFELIAFHLSTSGVVSEHMVPVFLALATAGAVVASLVLGRFYDRSGGLARGQYRDRPLVRSIASPHSSSSPLRYRSRRSHSSFWVQRARRTRLAPESIRSRHCTFSRPSTRMLDGHAIPHDNGHRWPCHQRCWSASTQC